MDLLSDVALLEVAQLKKTLKKSKLETHKLHASGLGDGVGSQPNVPDEQEDKTTSTDEGTGTKPGVPDVPKYLSEMMLMVIKKQVTVKRLILMKMRILISIRTMMKKNNMKKSMLKETEHEEVGKGDEEMTDTEVPLQSSSVSSDFANQFLNLDNVLPTDTEVVSIMNVKVRHEEPSTQTPPLLNISVTVISETSTAARSTIPSTIPPITHL
ncbi:hypothetical protein Tco_0528205 [Tanacetum coccineum]